MKNFVHRGDALDLIAPYAVTGGAGMLVGAAIVAIAASDAASGAAVVGYCHGVYDVTSDTGAAWAVGDVVYWDNTNKRFTKTSTSNTKAGYAVAAKQSADAVGRIKLIPTI